MAVKKVRNNISKSIDRQIRQSKQVPKKAYKFWRSITPYRSGNAKRNTRKSGNSINAGYKYATELDKGHSRQAKKGMSDPTTAYITRLLKRILRK